MSAFVALLPLHFGQLHAYEQALVLLVAFGPFLVLGVVVYIVRKRDLAADDTAPVGHDVARGSTPEPGDDGG